jgi:hypothetical protein
MYRRVEKDRGAFISRAENPLGIGHAGSNNHMWQAEASASRVTETLSNIEQNHLLPSVSHLVGLNRLEHT